MSDLNLIASRLPGATGAISALAITATVPDPPRNFIALDNGTILRGTVQGRDKDGLITIKTDHGYLKIATNANLQPGANVTLEVRSVGDRLQIVVLAVDQGSGHPVDQHGSAALPIVGESAGDTRHDGHIGGSSSNQAIDPATRSANAASADSKPSPPTVIVAGTRLTAIVIQAVPRDLLQSPTTNPQQLSGTAPDSTQPSSIDGKPASGRSLFTAEFLATPPPPISASLIPEIHDRIAALFAEPSGQSETTPEAPGVATGGSTLPPETRERIVALFVGQQPGGQRSSNSVPNQTPPFFNSASNAQATPQVSSPASQAGVATPPQLPVNNNAASNPPPLSGTVPTASATGVPANATPVTSSSPPPQPSTTLSPAMASPPAGSSQQLDGLQRSNSTSQQGTPIAGSTRNAQPFPPPPQVSTITQIESSITTPAPNAAAGSSLDSIASAIGAQRPAATTLPTGSLATIAPSASSGSPLPAGGILQTDGPSQQSSPDLRQPNLPPNLLPNSAERTTPQQPTVPTPSPPVAAAPSDPLEQPGRPSPAVGNTPFLVGNPGQIPAAAPPAPGSGTISNAPLQSPSLPSQSPVPGTPVVAPPTSAPVAMPPAPNPLPVPSGGGTVPVTVNPISQGAPTPRPPAIQTGVPASPLPPSSISQTSSGDPPPAPSTISTASTVPSPPTSDTLPQHVISPTNTAGSAAPPVPAPSYATATAGNVDVALGQKLVEAEVFVPQSQLPLSSLQPPQPPALPQSPPTSPAPAGISQLPPPQISPELLAQLVADAPDLVNTIGQPASTQAGVGLSSAINPTLLQIIANVTAPPNAVAWIAGAVAGPAGTLNPTSPEPSPSQPVPGQGHVPSVALTNVPANLIAIAIANAIPQDAAVSPSPIAPVSTNPIATNPGFSANTDAAGQSAPKTETTATATAPKTGTGGATPASGPTDAKESGIPLTAVVSSRHKMPLIGANLATANAEYLATNLAVSGASDSTVSKLDLTGKEQLAGPLPTGTEVRLRVLNIQSQAGLLVSAGATPGNKAAITGQILGHTPAGHPVIRTALGDLVLQQQATLPVGGEITLALEAVEMATSASGLAQTLTPQMTAMTLAQGWPTLLDLLMTLQHGLASGVPIPGAPGDASDAGAMAHLPQPGSKLAAGMAAAVDAFRSGDFEKLFGSLASSLKSTGTKQDAVRKLRDEFGQLSLLAQDRGNQDWKCFMLPLWDDGRLQQINLFYRRPRRQQSGGKDKNEDATRFVVDVNFTRLGGCQLDGLIRKKTFDLMVRSHRELPLPVKRDIAGLFAQAREIGNYAGEVSFQTALRFPVSPLDDIAEGPPSVTA